jgi:hypothetical protein
MNSVDQRIDLVLGPVEEQSGQTAPTVHVISEDPE